MVLEYLRKRGLKSAAQELRDQLTQSTSEGSAAQAAGRATRSRTAAKKGSTTTTSELVKKNAPSLPRSSLDSSNVLADPNQSKQVLTAVTSSMLSGGIGSTSNVSNLLNAVGMGVEDALSSSPTDRHEGFRDLLAWVDGSLDMYRVRGLGLHTSKPRI